MKALTLAVIGCLLVGVVLAAASPPPAQAGGRSSEELREQLQWDPYSLDRDEVRQLLNKWWYLTDWERNTLKQVADAKGVYKQNSGEDDDGWCAPRPKPWQRGQYQGCYPYYGPQAGPVYIQPGTTPFYNQGYAAPVVNPTYLTVETQYGPVQILIPNPAPAPPPAPVAPVCIPTGGGWGWGTFGTYDNWARAFESVHGRWPNKQDESDFWASQNFAAHTGYSPF